MNEQTQDEKLYARFRVIIILITIAGLAYINVPIMFPGLLGMDHDVYNCEPSYDIHSCHVSENLRSFDIQRLDCLITNKAFVAINPNSIVVWNYDKEGISLNTTDVTSSTNIPPNNTIHATITINTNADKSIVCSMDPQSAFIDKSSLKKL